MGTLLLGVDIQQAAISKDGHECLQRIFGQGGAAEALAGIAVLLDE